jgi:hypothetical protein
MLRSLFLEHVYMNLYTRHSSRDQGYKNALKKLSDTFGEGESQDRM